MIGRVFCLAGSWGMHTNKWEYPGSRFRVPIRQRQMTTRFTNGISRFNCRNSVSRAVYAHGRVKFTSLHGNLTRVDPNVKLIINVE